MEHVAERLHVAARERADAARLAEGVRETGLRPARGRPAEKGIQLLPSIVQIGRWGSRWVPESKKLDAKSRAMSKALQEGGPPFWARLERLMADLRQQHL